ncbi:MAG TPA: DUF305 domain-containing protein [Longimicrobiales bacterium]|nr:DUF305 domain-containing protein [Longimicrobiales bacterium]
MSGRYFTTGAILAAVMSGACTGGAQTVRAPITQAGAPGEAGRDLGAAEVARMGAPLHVAADARFMRDMIIHHLQAVEMTALVAERTTSADLRLLAERIEASQEDELRAMRRWLTERGEALPDEHAHHAGHDGHGADAHAGMPGMLSAAGMEQLRSARGAEFDRLFLEGMIHHHEGALVMVEQLFAIDGAGQETEIFQFASHVDSDQRMEIMRMRRMLAERSQR